MQQKFECKERIDRMTYALIFWSVLLVLSVGVEVGTQQLVSIWFAAGSLGAIIAATVGGSEMVQLIVFVALSFLLLIFTRPILRKVYNFEIKDTNAKIDLGKNAIVIQEIDPVKGTGRARLGDSEWIAVSAQKLVIPVGSVVKVCDIDGAKLIVELDSEKQIIIG